ncbi:MAG: anti-sigma F factor [Ruminococcaceae bacterium]|nr:anti-sigma F factor [Oscillospiraceae bacterium]
MENRVKIILDARSVNEGFARVAAAAFAARLDPTVEELADIKTAVSEAVTNAIIHGYEGRYGRVAMEMTASGNLLTISVSDKGRGIADIKQAMCPLYTSKPHLERSGMGFTVMESFMDSLQVSSRVGEGTRVVMTKRIHG